MLRDRILGGHALVITTSARGAYRTTAVLVDGGSSKYDLLLEQPSVLIGPGRSLWGNSGCGFKAASCLEPPPRERDAARRLAELFLHERRRLVCRACVD